MLYLYTDHCETFVAFHTCNVKMYIKIYLISLHVQYIYTSLFKE